MTELLTVEILKRSHVKTTLFMDGDDPKHIQVGHITEFPEIVWNWVKGPKTPPRGIRTFHVGDHEFPDGEWQAICDA
jgi:hypothetical protein